MRTRVIVSLMLASLSGTVLADRNLEEAEILRIFEDLTSRPRKTWIPSGTIRASHEEYRAPQVAEPDEIADRINQEVQTYLANPNKLELTEKLQQMKVEAIPFNVRYRLSNEYTMNSTVTVNFDGNRFYWEIDVDSRVDSIKPTGELGGNCFTEEFDLDWNQKRVFVWDGEKYIKYFRPGNHAIIGNTPGGINGPLTAAVIPWGYGRYSYEALRGAQASAREVESNAMLEIHLTILNGDKEEMFILDPAKDYAVKFYSAIVANTSMTVRNCSNYQLVGSNWCPRNIIIERYDTTTKPPKLAARDVWDFSSVSNGTPKPGSFDVDYDYDAFIEDYRFGDEPLQFRYSPPQEPSARDIRVEELLRDRLEIAYSSESQGQNCATVSLKYVCGRFGLDPSWKSLGELVRGVEKKTSMFEVQQFVHNLGLNSLAIRTDLQSLKVLDDCQVILHLPGNDHYVVLGDIDDKYVRLIDLDKNNFYCRDSVEHFDSIWDNTALIVGNGPTAKGHLAKIDDGQLREIIGAAECQECNTQIESSGTASCSNPVPGSCGGNYMIFYERWGCGTSDWGSCYESGLLHYEEQPCVEDENLDCVGYGEWTAYDIDACR